MQKRHENLETNENKNTKFAYLFLEDDDVKKTGIHTSSQFFNN